VALVLAALSPALGALRLVEVVPAASGARLMLNAVTRAAMTNAVLAGRVEERPIVGDGASSAPSPRVRETGRGGAIRERNRAAAPAADIMPDDASQTAAAAGSEPASLVSRSLIGSSSFESLPGVPTRHGAAASVVDASSPPSVQSPTPWNTAVEASEAVSRRSRDAAEATAGFFNRLGRRIAGSF
jgi:hypothetical protein